jgi:ABC-type antimicrobial peptide transport system permease subunit
MRAVIRTVRIVGLALITLGVIGVAAVIAMAEIGQGSKKLIAQRIESMGANNLLVMPGTASMDSVVTLTAADALAIAKECRPAVVGVAPVVRARTQVVYGDRNWVPVFIYGTTPSFLDLRGWNLDSGRSFTDQEVNGGSNVCLLGQTLVRELFQGESPIGEVIRVNNVPLTVIGTLEGKGAGVMIGVDQDDILLAPWRTIKSRIAGTSEQTANQGPAGTAGPTSVDQILVGIDTEPQIPGAIRDITELLRDRHRLRSGQPDDFSIRDMTEISQKTRSTSQTITWWLLIDGLIALVVVGVGILIIMLVSVTERTRAIGLRLAAGARPRDILLQFLTKAILLGFAGGVIGVLLGRLGSYLVWRFWHWPVAPSLPVGVAVLGASISVGLIFGCYPAWKASRLDPIEALPHE